VGRGKGGSNPDLSGGDKKRKKKRENAAARGWEKGSSQAHGDSRLLRREKAKSQGTKKMKLGH